MIKDMHQDYKPTDKCPLEYYLDAFNVDTYYELRHAKPIDLKISWILAEELEKDKKASRISEIPNFERGPSKSREPKEKKNLRRFTMIPLRN